MRRIVLAFLTLALACLAGIGVRAHEPSNAYLELRFEGEVAAGRLDLALRDLELVVGLDRDGDGAITWGELRGREPAIAAYALARLTLAAQEKACATRPTGLEVARRPAGTYAALFFEARCPGPFAALDVRYHLLFDRDPLHRGLATAQFGDATTSTVLAPDRRSWKITRQGRSTFQTALVFAREGVHHIWIGLDHLVFLVLLLLPAVVCREDGAWRPAGSFHGAFLQVAGIVTAFTLAHSITLALATFGWVALPPRLVEAAIATSIVLAALNNVWPVVTRGLFGLAFGFGLVHGLGFASALQELGLPQGQKALALLSFNLGIEAGQLLVVAGLFPLAFLLGRSALYPSFVLRPGSALIAVWATTWLLERALPA